MFVRAGPMSRSFATRAGGFFDRKVVDRVFRDNAEHPPLGRWLLGIASTLGEPFEVHLEGAGPDRAVRPRGPARPGSWRSRSWWAWSPSSAGRRWGRAAGAAAGFALLAMPRVFAHAHLAALDTFLSLFWTLALLAGERAMRSPRLFRAMAGRGRCLVAGPPDQDPRLVPVADPRRLGACSACRLGGRSPAMAIWALVGISLFWLGWPWLWYDPLARLRAYWGTGVARPTIMVQYFGQVFADRDVPWHYPWFYFAVTVPVGLQLLGCVGTRSGLEESPRRSVSAAAGRLDRGLSGPLQHAGAGLRRRTAVPARLSGLGAA